MFCTVGSPCRLCFTLQSTIVVTGGRELGCCSWQERGRFASPGKQESCSFFFFVKCCGWLLTSADKRRVRVDAEGGAADLYTLSDVWNASGFTPVGDSQQGKGVRGACSVWVVLQEWYCVFRAMIVVISSGSRVARGAAENQLAADHDVDTKNIKMSKTNARSAGVFGGV